MYFFLKFLADTHVLFWRATGTPVLDFWWCLLWGSKPEWVLAYSLFAEANVMYISLDPPLVLHLPTSWQPARSRSCPHILLQRWGCRDSNSCSQNICESDAQPTELNWDRQGQMYVLTGVLHFAQQETNRSKGWEDYLYNWPYFSAGRKRSNNGNIAIP